MKAYLVKVTFEIDVDAENENAARGKAITEISESSWQNLNVEYDIEEL